MQQTLHQAPSVKRLCSFFRFLPLLVSGSQIISTGRKLLVFRAKNQTLRKIVALPQTICLHQLSKHILHFLFPPWSSLKTSLFIGVEWRSAHDPGWICWTHVPTHVVYTFSDDLFGRDSWVSEDVAHGSLVCEAAASQGWVFLKKVDSGVGFNPITGSRRKMHVWFRCLRTTTLVSTCVFTLDSNKQFQLDNQMFTPFSMISLLLFCSISVRPQLILSTEVCHRCFSHLVGKRGDTIQNLKSDQGPKLQF